MKKKKIGSWTLEAEDISEKREYAPGQCIGKCFVASEAKLTLKDKVLIEDKDIKIHEDGRVIYKDPGYFGKEWGAYTSSGKVVFCRRESRHEVDHGATFLGEKDPIAPKGFLYGISQKPGVWGRVYDGDESWKTIDTYFDSEGKFVEEKEYIRFEKKSGGRYVGGPSL